MRTIRIAIAVICECILLNTLATINNKWAVISAFIILTVLMWTAKRLSLELEGIGEAKVCRILILELIVGLIVAEFTQFDKEFDIVPLMVSYYLITVTGVLLTCKGYGGAMTMNEIRQYSKLASMQKIAVSGINIHEFYPCRNFKELYLAYNKLGNECTIRTDKPNAGQSQELKFYIAKDLSPEKLKKISDEIVKDGCIAIISNGLRYDKYLRYNLVYKINEDGTFICEYSRKKVPLRHMYRYAESLNSLNGSLDSCIRDWDRRVAKLEDDRVDIREIRDILRQAYKVGIFNKYVEMSIYSTECGLQHKREVYWEI